MAVVQISKIQVRRGKKSQTNIPQLSGGEFGWAVDTQQLYIGNGSVSEGAPFVGNTEILTENSNIFDLLGAYSYKGYLLDNDGNSIVQTGATSNTPFYRSLQQKLDDIINVRDFGAQGDYANGVGTDDTASIQRAINQIYLNPANKTASRSRRYIAFPAGTYKISNVIYIPSNVTLIGEGIDKTIIFQDDETQSLLRTVATNSTLTNYVFLDDMDNDNAPNNVLIKGITFQRNPGSQTPTPMLMLDCLSKSVFDNCKFQGVWSLGAGEERSPVAVGTNSAVQIRGLGAVTTENIEFFNCEFTNVAHAVYSDYDSYKINFKNCTFHNLFRAFTLGRASTDTPGQSYGPQDYLAEDCKFDKIDAEAWKVYATTSSKNHRSINNKYYDVGNNSLEQSQPSTPVIDFNGPNCTSVGDFFQRNIDVNTIDAQKTTLTNLVAYLPDVLGSSNITYPTKSATLFYNTPDANPKILLKAPAWSACKVIIEYALRKNSSSLYRTGRLTVNVHPDMAGGIIKPTIVDDFSYNGQVETIGTTLGGNVKFFATVTNMSAVTYTVVGNQIVPSVVQRPTLAVRYSNPSGPGSNATMTYTVTIVAGNKDF